MRGIKKDEKFIQTQKKFQAEFPKGKGCHEVDECNWSLFKDAFLQFSKQKCPICEDTLNRYDDIDHQRPKSIYAFLKCCCDNYMIMCADCNRAFKRDAFPTEDTFIATQIVDVPRENPTLVNPRTDNVFEYFELLFIRRSHGKLMLELRARRELPPEKSVKAEKTIALYGIGDCDSDAKMDQCRINILETHFEFFFELAKARKRSVEKYNDMLRDRSMKKKKEYGFFAFIEKGQFEIIGV